MLTSTPSKSDLTRPRRPFLFALARKQIVGSRTVTYLPLAPFPIQLLNFTIAGTYFNTKGLKGLVDITNDTNVQSSRRTKHDPSNDGGLADITNTMYHPRIASNPHNDHTNGGIFGNQIYSTPSKNSKNSNDTIRAINNGSPTPTRGLYHSGRENAMSSSTIGTSILGFGREGFGRENSGGPTILERRRARHENRESSLIHCDSPKTP